MQDITNVAGEYGAYLQRLAGVLTADAERVRALADLINSAPAVHVFGFGRSGTAGLAMAIRLRHFLAPGQQVFWLGDQVRDPIRENDLVILFSKSGDRREVIGFLETARSARARCIAVTAIASSPLAQDSVLTIILPLMEESNPYGGGDFELSAWFFQEVFLDWYGIVHGIPGERVREHHI